MSKEKDSLFGRLAEVEVTIAPEQLIMVAATLIVSGIIIALSVKVINRVF